MSCTICNDVGWLCEQHGVPWDQGDAGKTKDAKAAMQTMEFWMRRMVRMEAKVKMGRRVH